MSQPAYRLFNVELKRREQLSPALTRFVFGGPEVAEMKTLAADQRIKIFFPDASGQPPSLPGGSEWYQAYRSVEPARRPPMRTYTIRALRAEQEEVDVEFVLHGENGPASAWATHARIGDRLQLAAPNRQYGDDPGGYEWKPPAGVRHILLIADETALPAVAGILEELAGEAEPPVVEAFLEVPGEADILDLPAIPAARLHWLPRHQAGIHSRNGERMIEAARQVIRKPFEANLEAVDCHHNYVQKERHFGQEVLVTRKGAVSAQKGQLGIIPGSMGAKSFIVRGLGNQEAFCSCSHGAGRTMSRTKAKKVFSVADQARATAHVECRKDADVIDEIPMAYKDIDRVMEAQRELVEVLHTLRQVVCVKG